MSNGRGWPLESSANDKSQTWRWWLPRSNCSSQHFVSSSIALSHAYLIPGSSCSSFNSTILPCVSPISKSIFHYNYLNCTKVAHVLLTITRTSFPDITTFQTLAKVHTRLAHAYPSMTDADEVWQVEVASELTYVFLLTAARASILFLYRRVFALTTPWFRIAWCCNLFLALGFFIALLVSLAFECAPKSIATLWNSPSDCHPSHNDPVIIGFLNALIDMLILLLPIKMVWSLQMPRRRKFAVCCIFGLGLA